MSHDHGLGSEPIACPICAQPLKRTTDLAFDCDRCGQFSNFGDRPLLSAQERQAAQAPRPSEFDPVGVVG
jgi:hypothetical protein